MTSNSSKKIDFGFHLSRDHMEAYPKYLKTWENLSNKNDFIPNNLSSQSKVKPIPTHCLRKCVKTSPPLICYLLMVNCNSKSFYLVLLL